ncbi:MAG: aminoacyl-histidine dipeptidase [Marinifilaceae bacterium]|jgi:dipeptidase D|nr:aminoacyl-histidine dipeptidase [Marinifilaceae bacterium]
MEKVLYSLKPQKVWECFEEICQVPRPSKKEEKIIEFLLKFGQDNNLETKRDEIGNVIIKKPASAGMEDIKPVVLQSHMDMVCEKNNDTVHDFDKDPIIPYIDGEWVKAKGTTLGADDGIGMAAQMALLLSDDIKHGPIECLFTVDEETGLSGAFALQPGFVESNILLNLDSEDEGEIFIGCAGGIDTLATMSYEKEDVVEGLYTARIDVKGLLGGHSGDEINKNRGNSNKILNRFLWEFNNKYGIRIAKFDGGNLRNAIPREAHAVIAIPSKYKENLRIDLNVYASAMEEEWKINEPKLSITMETCSAPEFVIDKDSSDKLLNAIYACPHGVFNMSTKMPGMVETSTNLASVKFVENNQIVITTSQRSDIENGKWDIAQMVESVFVMAGAKVEHTDGYPGWAPNPDSEILEVAAKSYEDLFGKKPIVRSIHAGLECGLFLEKYPSMDMISFGPTLRDVHSPDEKINIETVEKFWLHLVDILARIPKN